MKTIFLAGPMRGVKREESLGWRIKATKLLENNFNVVHALRGREEKETFLDPRAAVIRDKSDILNCDLVLVNDSVADVSMIGTAMEILFAHEVNKPIIVFGSVHSKDYWLNYHIHTRVKTLKQACEHICKLFI